MPLIINGETIDETVIEEEFDAIKDHHASLGEVVCCDRDEEFRAYAIENVTNRTLLKQEALRRFGKMPSQQEIDGQLEKLEEDHGGKEKFHQNIGMGPAQMDQIRAKVAETILVNQILADELGPGPEPEEKDYEKFYEDHLAEYMTPEEVQAWHIYLEPHNPAEAESAYNLLRKTRLELLAGADFETTSKTICAPEHKMDLGYFARGALMPEVETLTFSMTRGEISPVVATHFGYHIFKLVDRRDPAPIPFAEVREKIVERFPIAWREERINAFVGHLRKTATIASPQPEEVEHA